MIDKKRLEELLADPNANTESIYSGLGFNNEAAMYYHLKKDAEAKQMFKEWRATHRRTGQAAGEGKTRRKAAKRATKTAAPPRKDHANGRVSDELLRKLKLEFEHIAIYDSITEHFGELREELNAIK